MKILAMDIGKFKTVACEFDAHSGTSQYETIKTTPFSIRRIIARQKPDRVVFEVGSAAGWVHDIVASTDTEVQVANPNHEGWRRRNVKNKTDRKDAAKLAKLSAVGQLPRTYIPSRKTRQRRSLIGYRQSAIARRTRIKNRIRSILHRQGLTMKVGHRGWTMESPASLEQMARPWDATDADELWRAALHEELKALKESKERIVRIEKKLDELSETDGRVQQLQTIPGVGPRTAEALVAVIDDPHRFKRANQLGSYLGMVPRQFESGQMSRQGRITKQGNALLRTLLVEAGWVALTYNPRLRSVYKRITAGSKGRRKVAIVAVARRMLVIAWAMMRDGTEWDASNWKGEVRGNCKMTA